MKTIILILIIISLSSCSMNVVVQGQKVKSPQRISDPVQNRVIAACAIAGYAVAKHMDKHQHKP